MSGEQPAALFLADGSRFDGHGLEYEGVALGEAVFYTGMTGYEEALTDPSYAGQILTFTYPMIGNYGISGEAAQYPRACVAGTVIKQIAHHPSHHLSKQSLPSWLDDERIPALIGADTRAITIALREHGTIWAALAVGEDALDGAERVLANYARHATTRDLVPSVAAPTQRIEGPADGPHVTLVDCGVKRAVLRELEALGQTVETLRGLVGRKPLFGICLGHQLLALACGAKTYKLPYGHRGGNQPVRDVVHDDVLITAHNHGYAVDARTLPSELESTMTNLNDATNEGFRHRRLPIAAVQFHPEASPGPSDARRLFAEWFRTAEIPIEGEERD